METGAAQITGILLGTLKDVAPIAGLLLFFQLVVLRRPLPHPGRLVFGFGLVTLGLALFLIGLERALFPLGKVMAAQLTDPGFIAPGQAADIALHWWQYGWVYAFAFLIGFSTTIAEPSLIAVALKAEEASAGRLSPWGLRIAVALGVAISIALGAFRIISGTSLAIYMIIGYCIVIAQTLRAPRAIIPLAYDSGGVTTSTVTVPLVTALGLGLASTVPGRSPLIDGFGLIALASLFPMMTVMAYAQLADWTAKRQLRRELREEEDRP